MKSATIKKYPANPMETDDAELQVQACGIGGAVFLAAGPQPRLEAAMRLVAQKSLGVAAAGTG